MMLLGSRLTLKTILFNSDYMLMGPWCLPLPSDNLNHKNNQYHVLDCPWKTSESLSKAFSEVNDVYQNIMPMLIQVLNDFHGMRQSIRFWKILIGPWLYFFINVIYDKYFRLLKAQDENIGPFLGLKEKFFITPKNTLDFVVNINHNDNYNLQIMTEIAKLMEFKTIDSEVQMENNSSLQDVLFSSNAKNSVNLKLKLYFHIQKMFYSYADTILYKSGHASIFIKNLFLGSKGKVVEFPLDRSDSDICLNIVNIELRKKLQCKIDGLTSVKSISILEKLMLQLVSNQLPICFLEGFHELKKITRKKFGSKQPKKIASAVGWYFDEPFKWWAASCMAQGTQLFGLQHGGNYGISSYMFSERHEIEITDKYFTWGWEDASEKAIVASPAQKLLDINKYSWSEKKSADILYVGTSGTRFLIQFPEVPENFSKYFQFQIDFIENIHPSISEKMRVRLHYEDRIWEIKERLTEKFKRLRFEDWGSPFRESMSNAKIVVCDHLSTTFIEVLLANIPIILFWDPNIVSIRSSVQPYFNELKEVGILHDSAKSAAEFLNLQYDNVDKWWNSLKCQTIVKKFCGRFAKQTKQPVKDWIDLLSA